MPTLSPKAGEKGWGTPSIGLRRKGWPPVHDRPFGLPSCQTSSSRIIDERNRGSYQRSFNANCTWRAVVEVPVIAPAVPETPVGVKVIRFGVLKLARFSRLKISARNCKVMPSLRLVFLMVEKSQVARPGPLRLFLEAFPKNPLLGGGCRKAAGLYHWAGVPIIGLPVKFGLLNGLTGLRVSPSFEGL